MSSLHKIKTLDVMAISIEKEIKRFPQSTKTTGLCFRPAFGGNILISDTKYIEKSSQQKLNLHIATLDLEERLILEDGPSGLIKSDLTDHPPTPVQMDCLGSTTGQILSKC